MPSAQYAYGEIKTKPHTAASDLVPGDIVILGNTAGLTNGVAHQAIANTALGMLAIGGGTYLVKVASNYAKDTKVFWDAANAVLTSTSTNMSQFGYTLEAAAAANAVVRVLHHPYA